MRRLSRKSLRYGHEPRLLRSSGAVVFHFGRLIDVRGRRAARELRTPYRPATCDVQDVMDEWRSVSDTFGESIRSETRELVGR